MENEKLEVKDAFVSAVILIVFCLFMAYANAHIYVKSYYCNYYCALEHGFDSSAYQCHHFCDYCYYYGY